MLKMFGLLILVLFYVSECTAQNNIYTILQQRNGLSYFASLISGYQPAVDLYSGSSSLTLFVPNNTAFENLPRFKRDQILNLLEEEKLNYVKFYTVRNTITWGELTDEKVYSAMSPNAEKLFINARTRYISGGSGSSGITKRYINGAEILDGNYHQASNGMVYVIDRVLDVTSLKTTYGYMRNPEDTTLTSPLFGELADSLYGQYLASLEPLWKRERVTLFVPSSAAMDDIPAPNFQQLKGQPGRISTFFKQHYIPDKVVFTSVIYNNEGFDSEDQNTHITFRKTTGDKVYVNSGGVSALIVRGNITVNNGVIHLVDRMLGYVYTTAREQIAQDASVMNNLISQAPIDIQQIISQTNGVNMFIPTNEALARVQSIGIDIYQEAFRNKLLELHLIREGAIDVSQITGDFNSRQKRISRYQGLEIVVYNDRNETWAHGDFVRAMIVRADVEVTNGRLQFIDGVLGVPTMDIPTLIYYDTWLHGRTYVMYASTGLTEYLKDPRYNPSILPPMPTAPGYNVSTGDYAQCGSIHSVCQFTVFVPNGTSIELYQLSNIGREVMKANDRLRFILRRLIIPNQKIYLEKLAVGSSIHYQGHNGDTVRLTKESQNDVRLIYGSSYARVIMWDLGATNGVVHIVDAVLSIPADLYVDISTAADSVQGRLCLVFSFLFILIRQFC